MEILGIITTIVLPILIGGFIIAPYHRFWGISGWFASGAVCGLAFFTAIAFFFCLAMKEISWTSIAMANGLLLMMAYLLSRYLRPREIPYTIASSSYHISNKNRLLSFCVYVALGVILWLCMNEVLHITPEGYRIGFKNNYGDLPLHIHYASSFLFGKNFPPENPIYAEQILRYPFFCDFYSSLIWYATDNIEWAFEWPGKILGLSLLVLFFQWVSQLTQSRLVAAISCFVFFFSGGLGWIVWLEQVLHQSGDLFPQTYTILRESFMENSSIQKVFLPQVFGNVLHSLWVPQRGLQFAFPLVLILVALALDAAKAKDSKRFLFCALLAAPLPFFHGHSVLALGLMGVAFFFLFPSKSWLSLIIPCALIWLPQLLFFTQKIGPQYSDHVGFFKINLGWQSEGIETLWLWLKNAGPFFLLLFMGVLVLHNPFIRRFQILERRWKDAYLCAWAAFVLFLFANIFNLAPWNWDNIKILIYWYLFSVPLVSLVLVRMYRSDKKLVKSISLFLLLSLTLSAQLDLSHALFTDKENYMLFDKKKLKIAEIIKENVPPKANILIFPTFDSPVALTGRTLFMGYEGHIWSHGIKSSRLRLRAMRIMAEDQEGARQLFENYHITHALLGPLELEKRFKLDFFQEEFPLVGLYPPYRLYEIKFAGSE